MPPNDLTDSARNHECGGSSDRLVACLRPHLHNGGYDHKGSGEPTARARNRHSLDGAVDDSILLWSGGFWRGNATTMGILGRSNADVDSPVLL